MNSVPLGTDCANCGAPLAGPFCAAFFGHSAFAFHNAYGTRISGTLWRTAIVGTAYWMVVILGLAAVWLPAVLPLMTEYYGR